MVVRNTGADAPVFHIEYINQTFWRYTKDHQKDHDDLSEKWWEIYDRHEQLRNALKKSHARHESIETEWSPVDGQAMFQVSVPAPVNDQFHIIAKNITDLRVAEKIIESNDSYNRKILENSPDCLKIIDGEGRLKYMNTNGMCLMEIDNFGDFQNKYWWDLWNEEYSGIVRNAVEQARQGTSVRFDAFCATAKGTPKWWDVMVTPVQDKGDVITQIISTSRDITQQKEYEEQLRNNEALLEKKVNERTQELQVTNALLEARNKELEHFAFISSHDMQEPLRKIQMLGSVLQESAEIKLNEKNLTYLKKILQSAERMRTQISELLHFSKITLLKEENRQVNLHEEVQIVITEFEDIIFSKKAQIHVKNPLPLIHGNKWQCNMLFSNILANSLKFVHPDIPPVINIESRFLDKNEKGQRKLNVENDYALIRIQDNGIGFEQQYAKEAFDL